MDWSDPIDAACAAWNRADMEQQRKRDMRAWNKRLAKQQQRYYALPAEVRRQMFLDLLRREREAVKRGEAA